MRVLRAVKSTIPDLHSESYICSLTGALCAVPCWIQGRTPNPSTAQHHVTSAGQHSRGVPPQMPQKTADFGNKESAAYRRFQLHSVICHTIYGFPVVGRVILITSSVARGTAARPPVIAVLCIAYLANAEHVAKLARAVLGRYSLPGGQN